ncbi:unnamed protein product [Ostreobium quekettii]|uniref:Uncharacterized protein n=1 Tax=Ostreobium quekettii TaxID=121088 RepID=A0A8S1J2K7_9CHLO|nr:unnamed protein product [Ostreobium quekettii]
MSSHQGARGDRAGGSLLGAADSSSGKVESMGKRGWHMPWYYLCGNCDVLGWSSYTFSSSCPCIAQGFVRKAAFGHSVWMWSVVILFLLFPFYYMGSVGASSFVKTQCTYNTSTREMHCQKTSGLSQNAIIGMMSYLAVCWVIYSTVGAVMRSNIRKKFNLPGRKGDGSSILLRWKPCGIMA